MRILTVSFLSLFLMAMGGKQPVPPNTPTPPPPASVDSHYTKFKNLAQQYGAIFVADSVTFSFRSFFGSTVGMCTFSSSRRNKVELSTNAWNNGSDTFREMLLFHELGHCLLGRGHTNATHSSGRPESLMNSWLFDQRTYVANRDAYLKELYTANSTMRTALPLATKYDDCEFSKALREHFR